MKGEIDGDFYCSRFQHPAITCSGFNLCKGRKTGGECRHRKWPTPGQYLEEYGMEYPEGGAVYMNDDGGAWLASSLMTAKMYEKLPREAGRSFYVVCACTPWGKPPDTWRPE